MGRPVQGLVVVVLLAAAFFLGRWSSGGPSPAAPTVAQVATADPAATSVVGRAAVASVGTPAATARPARPGTSAGPSPWMPSSPQALPEIPVSPQATGPQPLNAEDEEALARAQRVMAADGGTTSDLLDLAKKEQRDAQARQLEELITQSILQHGGRYVAVRLSPPRCTRSVCIVRAIALARNAQDPRADWQRPSLAVLNEPWFREAFDDVKGFVGGDGPNTVYITMYVRCVPGTCAMGRN